MTDSPRRDRAGFTRRWGVGVVILRNAPWVSFGVHFDWHTPTLDLFLGRAVVQVGRNQHDFEGRVSLGVKSSSGHTDQCLCRETP